MTYFSCLYCNFFSGIIMYTKLNKRCFTVYMSFLVITIICCVSELLLRIMLVKRGQRVSGTVPSVCLTHRAHLCSQAASDTASLCSPRSL